MKTKLKEQNFDIIEYIQVELQKGLKQKDSQDYFQS